ncbi:response regulator transcription factor [Hydrogenophaga sp.]|uniref:response regulator n=1 Tax=Hydrogenophaga sp. TaxID=1904254 RepID=UPI0026297388|nr:response regulator transcription factor [Hydrogenophaga sp.]MCW5654394.1 response regulator transcription factor [Hydrogenophaga sp.]
MQSALILEDHLHAQDWLAQALAESFHGIAITRADTCAQARSHLAHMRPDIALIDLELPDGSGIDIVADLAQTQPACMTVVTTIFDDDEHLFASLRAGARGYLLKDQTVAELVGMLQRIAQGQPPLSPAIARRLLAQFRSTASTPPPVALSARESEVLAVIAQGHTLPEVAQLLGLSRHTVSGYVKDIYRKLNINSRAEATLEAARRGLIGAPR